MARIKHVLSERRIAYEYAIRQDPVLFGLDAAPEPHVGYKAPPPSAPSPESKPSEKDEGKERKRGRKRVMRKKKE